MKANAPAGNADREYLFELTGGRLFLDFANTVDNRPAVNRKELLKSYFDLLSWSKQAGAISDKQYKRLYLEAKRRPTRSAAVLRQAKTLREAIFGVFSAIASGRPPRTGDLEKLNGALPRLFAHTRIERTKDGFQMQYAGEEDALDQMLWPVIRSAVEFLSSQELPAVRECAADNCAWLFMDTTRNQSRRWCNMKVCGNRAKVRRFRQRKRA